MEVRFEHPRSRQGLPTPSRRTGRRTQQGPVTTCRRATQTCRGPRFGGPPRRPSSASGRLRDSRHGRRGRAGPGGQPRRSRASATPILPIVVEHLHTPSRSYAGSSSKQLATDGREVAHALGRLVRGDLAGLFDGPSTVTFDPNLPMLSFDLSHISGSDQLLGLVMACASAWMEASLADPSGGQRLVVYDEAWRLIAHPSLLARMQARWKLSRAWGLANLMIVHRLSDLDAVGDAGSEARGLAQGLLGDTATASSTTSPTTRPQPPARSSDLPRPRSASSPTSLREKDYGRSINELSS